jgi:hypothetical protein
MVDRARCGSYEPIADCSCGATTIRGRRGEWIRAGIFAELNKTARESRDRLVGLVLGNSRSAGTSRRRPAAGNAPARARLTGGNPA